MNKFETDFNGKVPIFLDDLRFMDAIFRNIILRMAQGFGVSRFGADYSFNANHNIYSVNSGVIIIEDELFYFPGGSVVGGDQDRIAFGILETKTGNRVTGANIPIQCYTNRTAYLVNMDSTVYTGDYTWLDENSAGKRFEPAFLKNTAFNKKFGNQAGNVPEINSSLGPSMVVVTASNTKLNTENRGTAFNKNFGITEGLVAEGNHSHSGIYEPVFTKNSAFNKSFGGSGSADTVARSDHGHEQVFITATINSLNFTATSAVRYRKIGKQLQIVGKVFRIGPEELFFTLPSEYRPLTNISTVVGGDEVATSYLEVQTNGSVLLPYNASNYKINILVPLDY